MEEDKSECAIEKQKDAKNEVTYDVLNYFNLLSSLEKMCKVGIFFIAVISFLTG